MDTDKISFKSLNEGHFDLIKNWFNAPHVQAFYSLRSWTSDDVYKKLMPYIREENQMHSFVIYFEKYPIGYIQYYPVKEHPWENQDLSDEIIQEAAGFDLFIGDKNYLRKGFGSQIIESFLEKYIWPNYRYCLVDPDVRNEASIRLFKKCGFKEHKEVNSHNALKQSVFLKLLIREKR